MSNAIEKARRFEELRRFACESIPKAIAVYTYIKSSSDYSYTNVTHTLQFLGLSTIDAERMYRDLEEKFSEILRKTSSREVEDIVLQCLEKLNVREEARRRIEALSEEDKKILQIAALGIIKRGEKYSFGFESFSSEDLAKLVSVMLSRDLDYVYLEKLFVKTLLAVRSHSESRRYYYYTMYLIPSAIEIVKELAQTVENEWPSYDYIYSKLRYSVEPHQVAALCRPDELFYEAIYGYKIGDILDSTVIEKIAYKGAINHYIEHELHKAIQTLSQEYCHNIMVNYLVGTLESIGYEVDLKHRGFMEFSYCCRYTAVKPGIALYIYVCPFAVRLPDVGKDEKAIIVVEGIGAKLPEYLERLRSDSWRAHLANALWLGIHKNKIYVLNTTTEKWQQEIVEALRKPTTTYVPEAVERAEKPTITQPATTPLTVSVEEKPVHIPSRIIQTREVLESIVAQAFRALGFSVWTNRRMVARRGASIEVDVWAEKRVGDTRFKVYVSCKNWNRDVDRSVVDEEFGRVFNLQEVPHLRILVVKSMSGPAKEVAEADGFFVIELREKATEANAEEIYELIYRKLSDLFTNIAPPQLLEIARKVSKTAEELSKIAQELAKLSKSYGQQS